MMYEAERRELQLYLDLAGASWAMLMTGGPGYDEVHPTGEGRFMKSTSYRLKRVGDVFDHVVVSSGFEPEREMMLTFQRDLRSSAMSPESRLRANFNVINLKSWLRESFEHLYEKVSTVLEKKLWRVVPLENLRINSKVYLGYYKEMMSSPQVIPSSMTRADILGQVARDISQGFGMPEEVLESFQGPQVRTEPGCLLTLGDKPTLMVQRFQVGVHELPGWDLLSQAPVEIPV